MATRRRSGRARRGVVVACAAAAIAASGTAAVAYHVDSLYPTGNYLYACPDGRMGDHFCLTDNSSVAIWRQSNLTTTGQSNIGNILSTEFAPTDLTITYSTSPVYTGDGETDLIYQARTDLPSGADGVAWCNDAVSDFRCDQHYAAFRYSTPSKEIVCHETGHTMGLTHGQQADPRISNTDSSLACMQTPVPTYVLGGHNTNLINQTY